MFNSSVLSVKAREERVRRKEGTLLFVLIFIHALIIMHPKTNKRPLDVGASSRTDIVIPLPSC